MKYLIVFFGSGIGGCLRLAIYRLQEFGNVSFPIATLACNFIGSITIVLLSQVIKDINLKLLLITGLLGGFTTYSTFVLDIAKTPHYAIYILANMAIVTICLIIFKVLQ
ncbi:MAG: CrcB family protein [Proteobacteria bacterium]|jgi:fluoride exporter|nr:CrcB family protein [Pseudomonadota bacterium]